MEILTCVLSGQLEHRDSMGNGEVIHANEWQAMTAGTGIRRTPGHFSNLRFNITLGPPLFAPLLFSAVGLLGLIAMLLRREEDVW